MLKVRAADKDKLFALLEGDVHCIGTVSTSNRKVLGFKCAGRPELVTARVGTFHTHPRSAKMGGYDPPSRKDLYYLLNGNRSHHYVVSHRGIYEVRVHCKVKSERRERLLREMTEMQDRLQPSRAYNGWWMRAVNGLAPSCLKVKFIPWQKVQWC